MKSIPSQMKLTISETKLTFLLIRFTGLKGNQKEKLCVKMEWSPFPIALFLDHQIG